MSIRCEMVRPNRREIFGEQTFGYFIYQDSSYGNTLLPVIPRISSPDEETEETPNLKTEHVAKSSEEKPLVIEID